MSDAQVALAAQALAHYDLGGDIGGHTPVPLAESFNTVFRVDTRTARYVLRVGPEHRVHPPGSAALEARWTRDLAARGLPVPRIVPTREGAPSVQVTAPGRPASRECTMLTWQPGRTPPMPFSPDDITDLAALAARLHDASPPLVTRPAGALSARSVLHFALADRLDELGGPARDVLAAARDRAQLAVDELWRTAGTPPRLIHSDLTPANVVRDGPRMLPIDFQDLTWAQVQQDLAHTIYGITRGLDLAAGLDAVRTAYERVRPWPGPDLALLADLVAARRVAMVNLAVHRARPALPAYADRHAEALRRYVG